MKIEIGMIFYNKTHLWYVSNIDIEKQLLSFTCFCNIEKNEEIKIKKNTAPLRNFTDIFNGRFIIEFPK